MIIILDVRNNYGLNIKSYYDIQAQENYKQAREIGKKVSQSLLCSVYLSIIAVGTSVSIYLSFYSEYWGLK